MPVKILMPALSPTMTEGNLVKWHKKEGDTISAGDVMAEIETDKATMEVEAVDEGTLGRIIIPEGTENVQVNQVIALLLEEDEDASALESVEIEAPAEADSQQAPANEDEAPAVQETQMAASAAAPSPMPTVAPASSGGRIFASPVARRIAAGARIDLAAIQGTGPKGRIVKADIEAAIAGGGTSAAAPLPTGPTFDLPPRGGAYQADETGLFPAYTQTPATNVRKVIAQRLTEAKQQAPHFYLTIDCDIDPLLKLRKEMNAALGEGAKVTVNDLLIRACAMALMKVPAANASWHGDHTRQYSAADIAVAVAIEDGLVTPIVRNANGKGLPEISREIKDLVQRARANKLRPEEFQGGTFTLSNLGMFGIRDFSAILNPPQGAILAVGAGEQRPVVKDGEITIATMMTCTLSVDHRVVDGATGAEFLKAFKHLIINPVLIVL